MTCTLTTPFAQVRKAWRLMDAPVYLRRLPSNPNRFSVILRPGHTVQEAELFLFGYVLTH